MLVTWYVDSLPFPSLLDYSIDWSWWCVENFEFLLRSPTEKTLNGKTLLCIGLVPRMRYCLWNQMTIWTSTFPHVLYGSFLQEICWKKNSGLKRTTGYRKYAARCFALVSTCCPVSLYFHTYLVHYVTAVCMIACLSIVRSKLSDLYEWLH